MIGPHGFTKRVLYKPDEREVEKFFAMPGKPDEREVEKFFAMPGT